MTWKFDESIAKIFVQHAQQHIPNYDAVIDKTVDICRFLLSEDSSIIDVGCATGNTLSTLYYHGFKNLYGVDSSQDMLNYCQVPATLFCSNDFPKQMFDAVICNWTLHFIQDKETYLENIYQNINPNGFMILSEKTNLDSLPIHFYHQYKLHAGVSLNDIKQKEQDVKDIMFIDTPDWYMNILPKTGFSKVYIIDANWCFTTFLCLK